MGKEDSMSTPLEDFKCEHENITNIVKRIKHLGVHTMEGRNKLLESKEKLLFHLKKQVEELYPELKKAAENDPNLKSIASGIENEMHEIANFTSDFFKKYSVGGGGIDFLRDFEKLISALESRLEEEESRLEIG
jgi:hypothetical protein